MRVHYAPLGLEVGGSAAAVYALHCPPHPRPFARAMPWSMQQRVLFPRFWEPTPILPFVNTPPPFVREPPPPCQSHWVLFLSTFGILVLLLQSGGGGGCERMTTHTTSTLDNPPMMSSAIDNPRSTHKTAARTACAAERGP